jgi:hypothetical protein
MHVAGAGPDDEQAIQAPERHGAVRVEEVHGKHRRGLRAQELPPSGVGAPLRSWGDLQGFEHAADRGGADPVAELEQLTLDPLIPQPRFSVASRSISATISALTGGRPSRFG